jgi:hypothetical protein
MPKDNEFRRPIQLNKTDNCVDNTLYGRLRRFGESPLAPRETHRKDFGVIAEFSNPVPKGPNATARVAEANNPPGRNAGARPANDPISGRGSHFV